MRRPSKQIIVIVSLFCIAIMFFSGCRCKHAWKDATCTEPRTCNLCGKTEGSALGHSWSNSTCVSPRTCIRCGEKDGMALGHDWMKATCSEPRTCNRCGEIDGVALGHQWSEATCAEPKTCDRCGATDGDPLGHQWSEATCTEPKTCDRCGATEGEALGHSINYWIVKKPANCVEEGIEAGVCEICGEEQTQVLAKQEHQFGKWEITKEATCTEKGYKKRVCKNCKMEETQEIPISSHKYGDWEIIKDATPTDPGTRIKKCRKCGSELKRESFNLLEREKVKWLKDNCQSNLYNNIARSPNQFKGQYVQFDCRILQIVSETTTKGEYSSYRASTKDNWDDVVYLCIDNYEMLNLTLILSNAVKDEPETTQKNLRDAFLKGNLDNLESSYPYVTRQAAENAVSKTKYGDDTYYKIEILDDGTEQLVKLVKIPEGYQRYTKRIYNINPARILEDDTITVYGFFDGLITYSTILGQSITIPKIIVLHYEIKVK